MLNCRLRFAGRMFKCRRLDRFGLALNASARVVIYYTCVIPSPNASVTSIVFLLFRTAAQISLIQWMAPTCQQGIPLQLGHHLGISCDGYVSRKHSDVGVALQHSCCCTERRTNAFANAIAFPWCGMLTPGRWELSLVV
jgi:hypothetical protein